MIKHDKSTTICAVATPAGHGAIAVIRVSGQDAIKIVDGIFKGNKNQSSLINAKTHTLKFGKIIFNEEVMDEVLVGIFKTPNSYTGEDTVEISCHGSIFIQQKILEALTQCGCRMAEAGEFTLRAFLNGKLDLTQAEAVADLIASENSSSHLLALQQLKGGYSAEIKKLREEIIQFASLIELELDFAEEDVEFANREQFKKLITKSISQIENLLKGFEYGNILKNGVPVVIAGKPNVGKSTLLNVLLNEDRAIVSEIAGTTRDAIEDAIIIEGLRFRFIDTAGIRTTTDSIEAIGVEKTFSKINEAKIVLYVFDAGEISLTELKIATNEIKLQKKEGEVFIIAIANKMDKYDDQKIKVDFGSVQNIVFISAKNKNHIDDLKQTILNATKKLKTTGEHFISNARHAASLRKAMASLQQAKEALDKNISNDFIAADVRYALNCLGEITGEITTDDLLENIFSKFCIGK